jgi:penicillin V acylase-like amidase (Ntn superfamily)
MKMKRLLKDIMIKEQSEKEPQVKVMDIIQLVLDLEDKVLEVKKKLKEIQPIVNPKPQGHKIDKDFFKRGDIDELPKKPKE